MQKNSSSICSNSRVRKMKLPGVISLRKLYEKTMEKIVALCKGRGFIFAGSEIYGGLANTWDYGPLLSDALEGLEHEVELPDIGKIVFTAGGAITPPRS